MNDSPLLLKTFQTWLLWKLFFFIFFYFQQSHKPLLVYISWGCWEQIYCFVPTRDFKEIANPKRCFIWSVLTKTQTQTVDIPAGRFRTTKSSWPKSTEHRQCTDNLAQAEDGTDLSLTQWCALAQHCTHVLLRKEEADRMYAECRRVQMSVSRCSCDGRSTSGHVGERSPTLLSYIA